MDVPDQLRLLPKGRYEIVPVDDLPELTDEEQAGLEAALESARRGRVISSDEVGRRVAERLAR